MSANQRGIGSQQPYLPSSNAGSQQSGLPLYVNWFTNEQEYKRGGTAPLVSRSKNKKIKLMNKVDSIQASGYKQSPYQQSVHSAQHSKKSFQEPKTIKNNIQQISKIYSSHAPISTSSYPYRATQYPVEQKKTYDLNGYKFNNEMYSSQQNYRPKTSYNDTNASMNTSMNQTKAKRKTYITAKEIDPQDLLDIKYQSSQQQSQQQPSFQNKEALRKACCQSAKPQAERKMYSAKPLTKSGNRQHQQPQPEEALGHELDYNAKIEEFNCFQNFDEFDRKGNPEPHNQYMFEEDADSHPQPQTKLSQPEVQQIYAKLKNGGKKQPMGQQKWKDQLHQQPNLSKEKDASLASESDGNQSDIENRRRAKQQSGKPEASSDEDQHEKELPNEEGEGDNLDDSQEIRGDNRHAYIEDECEMNEVRNPQDFNNDENSIVEDNDPHDQKHPLEEDQHAQIKIMNQNRPNTSEGGRRVRYKNSEEHQHKYSLVGQQPPDDSEPPSNTNSNLRVLKTQEDNLKNRVVGTDAPIQDIQQSSQLNSKRQKIPGYLQDDSKVYHMPIKADHTISNENHSPIGQRPPSRHKTPPKALGLGIPQYQMIDIPIKNMYTNVNGSESAAKDRVHKQPSNKLLNSAKNPQSQEDKDQFSYDDEFQMEDLNIGNSLSNFYKKQSVPKNQLQEDKMDNPIENQVEKDGDNEMPNNPETNANQEPAYKQKCGQLECRRDSNSSAKAKKMVRSLHPQSAKNQSQNHFKVKDDDLDEHEEKNVNLLHKSSTQVSRLEGTDIIIKCSKRPSAQQDQAKQSSQHLLQQQMHQQIQQQLQQQITIPFETNLDSDFLGLFANCFSSSKQFKKKIDD